MTMARYVIEVTDFKSEVRFVLRGCLEAVVASEVARKAYISISNMHMDLTSKAVWRLQYLQVTTRQYEHGYVGIYN